MRPSRRATGWGALASGTLRATASGSGATGSAMTGRASRRLLPWSRCVSARVCSACGRQGARASDRERYERGTRMGHAAGGRGGFPPCRAEDGSQALFWPRRSWWSWSRKVCVRARVRARVHARVHACVHACVYACVRVCGLFDSSGRRRACSLSMGRIVSRAHSRLILTILNWLSRTACRLCLHTCAPPAHFLLSS